MKIAINTDAHSSEQLRFMNYDIDQARRGWLEKRHVINTLSLGRLEIWLKQRQNRASPLIAGSI